MLLTALEAGAAPYRQANIIDKQWMKPRIWFFLNRKISSMRVGSAFYCHLQDSCCILVTKWLSRLSRQSWRRKSCLIADCVGHLRKNWFADSISGARVIGADSVEINNEASPPSSNDSGTISIKLITGSQTLDNCFDIYFVIRNCAMMNHNPLISLEDPSPLLSMIL